MSETRINSLPTNVSEITTNVVSEIPTNVSEVSDPIDICSIQGIYGWKQFGKCKIPYLTRIVNKTKLIYVSTQMAETYLLANYLPYVSQELFSAITCVIGYLITKSEAGLLNFINEINDHIYSKDRYQAGKDYIVRLEDVKEFYFFMKLSYNALIRNVNTFQETKCGFIIIDSTSVVPYCIRDDKKYMPVFCFEGYERILENKTVKLKHWDLLYLKFCSKIQGIKNKPFYDSDWCDAISLCELKKHFPESIFRDFWPPSKVTALPPDLIPTYYNVWFKPENIAPENSPAPTTIEPPSVTSTNTTK